MPSSSSQYRSTCAFSPVSFSASETRYVLFSIRQPLPSYHSQVSCERYSQLSFEVFASQKESCSRLNHFLTQRNSNCFTAERTVIASFIHYKSPSSLLQENLIVIFRPFHTILSNFAQKTCRGNFPRHVLPHKISATVQSHAKWKKNRESRLDE